jgi:endonuclease YncB( thermonuclease family)
MVLLTVNVEGSDVLIGIASVIDGDTIEIYGQRIRLGDRKTLLEEACGSPPHSWTCSAGS